jgi:hypothetical protein
LLGPKVKGNGENDLAVSLVAGLTRPDDTMLFGEFAQQRRAKLCAAERGGGFGRVWVEGQATYSITMPGLEGESSPGCQRSVVIAELDWRDASVQTPATDNPNGESVRWLDDFRAGDAP